MYQQIVGCLVTVVFKYCNSGFSELIFSNGSDNLHTGLVQFPQQYC